jgi:hypothetical protein
MQSNPDETKANEIICQELAQSIRRELELEEIIYELLNNEPIHLRHTCSSGSDDLCFCPCSLGKRNLAVRLRDLEVQRDALRGAIKGLREWHKMESRKFMSRINTLEMTLKSKKIRGEDSNVREGQEISSIPMNDARVAELEHRLKDSELALQNVVELLNRAQIKMFEMK